MVRLELDQVLVKRMKEDDIEVVKALVKVCQPVPVMLMLMYIQGL